MHRLSYAIVLLAGTATYAQSMDGHWANIDPHTDGAISVDSEGTKLHPFGHCDPRPCDQGVINATQQGVILRAEIDRHFAIKSYEASPGSGGRLSMRAGTRFTENSGRVGGNATHIFKRTASGSAVDPSGYAVGLRVEAVAVLSEASKRSTNEPNAQLSSSSFPSIPDELEMKVIEEESDSYPKKFKAARIATVKKMFTDCLRTPDNAISKAQIAGQCSALSQRFVDFLVYDEKFGNWGRIHGYIETATALTEAARNRACAYGDPSACNALGKAALASGDRDGAVKILSSGPCKDVCGEALAQASGKFDPPIVPAPQVPEELAPHIWTRQYRKTTVPLCASNPMEAAKVNEIAQACSSMAGSFLGSNLESSRRLFALLSQRACALGSAMGCHFYSDYLKTAQQFAEGDRIRHLPACQNDEFCRTDGGSGWVGIARTEEEQRQHKAAMLDGINSALEGVSDQLAQGNAQMQARNDSSWQQARAHVAGNNARRANETQPTATSSLPAPRTASAPVTTKPDTGTAAPPVPSSTVIPDSGANSSDGGAQPNPYTSGPFDTALNDCIGVFYKNDSITGDHLILKNNCSVRAHVLFYSSSQVYGGTYLDPGESDNTYASHDKIVAAGGVSIYACPANDVPRLEDGKIAYNGPHNRFRCSRR